MHTCTVCILEKQNFNVIGIFLKSRGSVIKNNFLLNTEQNKSTFLQEEILFIHYLLQINLNIFSIGTFRVYVVTQSSVKV